MLSRSTTTPAETEAESGTDLRTVDATAGTRDEIETSQISSSREPPDGGVRAWLCVLGGFLCQLCSFGFINALGAFQYEYQTKILRGHSASSISWISTVQLFLMFFLSQPVGMLVDMFDFRLITLPASLLAVGGLLALSYAREYHSIFLAQSMCFGMGASGIFMPGLVGPGQYFKQHRALALGIVASGSSLGGLVFPIFLNRSFERMGFGETIRWAAMIIGVGLAIANVVMRPLHKPKGWAGKRALFRTDVFRQIDYLAYVTGCFFVFWGLFGPFNYLPTFTAGFEATRSVSHYIVSIANTMAFVGRIIPSYFADKTGRLSMMTSMAIIGGIANLIIWLAVAFHPAMSGTIVFALIFGFSSGGFVSLMTACLIDVVGGQTHDLGAMLGTFMVVVSFAALTGLPIQGAIPADGARPIGLIAFAGVCMLVGGAILAFAWMRWSRRQNGSAQGQADGDLAKS